VARLLSKAGEAPTVMGMRLGPGASRRMLFLGSALAIWGTAALVAASGEPAAAACCGRIPGLPSKSWLCDHARLHQFVKTCCDLTSAVRSLGPGPGGAPGGEAAPVERTPR
jgi:hypothetical protein